MKSLQECAKVIRSKNSGPFTLTLDIIFRSSDDYEKVKKNQLIGKTTIANLYGFSEETIQDIIFFDPAKAVKIIFPRNVSSGSPGDSDVYGAQQHSPLLKLMLDI
jgi:hypothetical protein